MRRRYVVALIVACLVVCLAGTLATWSSPVAVFVLPDATDVTVAPRGLAALRLSYRAPGPPYAWRDAIWRQLVQQGWRSRDYTFGTTREFAVTWYSRRIDLGPVVILESAVVGGDPDDPALVNIEFHRQLRLKE